MVRSSVSEARAEESLTVAGSALAPTRTTSVAAIATTAAARSLCWNLINVHWPPIAEADDGSRTRDLELGKLALYQLSYVRVGGIVGDLQTADFVA